jgi:hypothetical protein
VDNKKLAIDAKKATQKPASTKRSLEELAESVLLDIENEVMLMRKSAGNPNHVASGEHGGEFASGGGAGGKAHGKHYAKRQRRKAKKRAPGTKREHKPSAKAKLDRLKKGKPAEYKSEKAKRAAANQQVTDGPVQQYTKANEANFAARLGRGAKAFPDNGPVDIELKANGKTQGIELKTLVTGKNDKLTMATKPKPYEKKSAIERKTDWQDANGTTVHSVALDHRDRAIHEGVHIGNKELHSGHEIYYKRGTGSFRIGAMHKVQDVDELHKLIAMPYDKLPKKAQGDQRGGKT